MLLKVLIYLVLSQSYLNLRELDKIFQNVTPSFLVAKNADKCFSARKMGRRVFDRHFQDVDSGRDASLPNSSLDFDKIALIISYSNACCLFPVKISKE